MMKERPAAVTEAPPQVELAPGELAALLDRPYVPPRSETEELREEMRARIMGQDTDIAQLRAEVKQLCERILEQEGQLFELRQRVNDLEDEARDRRQRQYGFANEQLEGTRQRQQQYQRFYEQRQQGMFGQITPNMFMIFDAVPARQTARSVCAICGWPECPHPERVPEGSYMARNRFGYRP